MSGIAVPCVSVTGSSVTLNQEYFKRYVQESLVRITELDVLPGGENLLTMRREY